MTVFIDQLTEPRVRALAWSCFSAPMIQQFSAGPGLQVSVPEFSLNEHRQQWLLELDRQPQPLYRFLEQHCHSRRLGLVFEALWHFFLSSDPETELLAHNLPVRDGGKTLGEFDILYSSNAGNQTYHLELAVKFFLAAPQPVVPDNPLSHWLGPNVQDRLDLKLERLRDHQLQLATLAPAQAVLKKHGISAPQPQLLFKGWLFQNWQQNIALPAGINPAQAQGRWLPVSAFTPAFRERYPQWYWLEKPQWLDGHRGAKALNEQCLEWARTRPQMLVACDDSGREQLRLFVTPDDWPQL